MSATLCYEYPLNERLRRLLRLEFVFARVLQTAPARSPWDSISALQGVSELGALAGRAELRSELFKELDRHYTALDRLRRNPAVDGGLLEATLQTIVTTRDRLRNLDRSMLEASRRNDFLDAVRQRSGPPGELCPADLPALHHWLQQDSAARASHIGRWLEPFQPVQAALDLALSLLRDSAAPRRTVAERGFFQEALSGPTPPQLLRVFTPAEYGVFPDISGGRRRCAIRFMSQPDPEQRAAQVDEDIYFWVAYCAL